MLHVKFEDWLFISILITRANCQKQFTFGNRKVSKKVKPPIHLISNPAFQRALSFLHDPLFKSRNPAWSLSIVTKNHHEVGVRKSSSCLDLVQVYDDIPYQEALTVTGIMHLVHI
jgi:hypothetical protein